MSPDPQAEIAALKIILSNVVARLAIASTQSRDQIHEMLDAMKDECKLAAEQTTLPGASVADRARVVNDMLASIDQFFKAITIT